ncbi:GNAT family acetyltransferase [Paenibacillus oryzae]|uniref:GNAT family acetyltransferase n=1 Tax=Paenibacillus oryzae TaxID=1844972 RepID=A0A1A5YL16_9BACL|nr:GNAT family N-acetyltransferase [Paenibacillus oryzae]OBR66327.1 GNAT family acetyltransferase [Paenibacillus oryzae]
MTMPEFTLADSSEHVSLLTAMANEIWQEYYTSLISAQQISYMLDKFQSQEAITSQIRRGELVYYLMTEQQAPLGYFAFAEKDGALFLSKLYVLKRHRGKGAASKAISFLEQICSTRGLKTIWLTVNRYNAASIAVYEKKGFVKIREQVGDIGNGYVMDDFIMEKAIIGDITNRTIGL